MGRIWWSTQPSSSSVLSRSSSCYGCSVGEDTKMRTEEHGLHFRMKTPNRPWCHEMDAVSASMALNRRSKRCPSIVQICGFGARHGMCLAVSFLRHLGDHLSSSAAPRPIAWHCEVVCEQDDRCFRLVPPHCRQALHRKGPVATGLLLCCWKGGTLLLLWGSMGHKLQILEIVSIMVVPSLDKCAMA